jgi:hypothetical protein
MPRPTGIQRTIEQARASQQHGGGAIPRLRVADGISGSTDPGRHAGSPSHSELVAVHESNLQCVLHEPHSLFIDG